MSFPPGVWYDGLAVIEELCGSPTIDACRVPTVKPGPCPGYRRGTSTGRPARTPRTRSGDQDEGTTRPTRRSRSTPRTTPGTTAPKETPPKSGGVPSMGDLIQSGTRDDPKAPEMIPEFAKVLNGTFGGLTTQVVEVFQRDNRSSVTVAITDADGEDIGVNTITLHRGNGDNPDELWAYTDILEIRPQARGAGFMQEWNKHLQDWYRDSGATHVRLEANKDVGGYAWARQGYDFADKAQADKIYDRARGMLSYLEESVSFEPADSPRRASLQLQVDAGRELLRRVDENPFGTPGAVSAYDLAQAGRQSGQGAVRDSWFGKFVLLGSGWDGVKWL